MKKKLPKISIITPSYNQGHFIEQTITSVLDQKYPNLEYWVIDGGSTDDTIKILKKYGKQINWISEKDKGQTDAINKGLQKCSGEVVAYLNSDDIFLPGTLMKVGEFFHTHPDALWFSGDAVIIDAQGQEIQSFVRIYKNLLRKFPYLWLLGIANFIIQPSTFWRRSVHSQLGKFDTSLRYCMDYDFWFRLYTQADPVFCSQAFSAFRIHGQSKGGSQFERQFAEEAAVAARYITNPLILLLHKLHASAIVIVYKLIK